MLANEAAQDAIAQNIANAATTGFKRDLPQFQSFQEALLQSTAGSTPGATVGGLGPGVGVRGLATDFSDGALQQTGNPLDIALTGDAFLAVQTPQGVRYSRDGALTRDAQGQLVQANGSGAVLDPSGRPISLPAKTKNITITPSGGVLADGVSVGRLQLVSLTRTSGASKQGDNLFSQPNVAPAGPNATVHQGYLESSNVNIVKEMVAMISVQRAYETDQKMVQAEDEATNKAANDVPKV